MLTLTVNFIGGTLRMLFPFSMGVLLSRNFKPVKLRGALDMHNYYDCFVRGALSEGAKSFCVNGAYEVFCVKSCSFPYSVWLGISGTTTDKKSTRYASFWEIYSILSMWYIIPLRYLFYGWLHLSSILWGETWASVKPVGYAIEYCTGLSLPEAIWWTCKKMVNQKVSLAKK